jgi:gold/copper resistance efflux system membrane fusion protein
MADRQLAKLLSQVCGPAASDDGGLSDAQLLARFVASRDEAAFELLVWRHRRLVLGVCRRVLRDLHDAEDAFQATFLALARKAGAIRRREALAAWLYRVAWRVALTARSGRKRRAAREVPLDGAGPATPPADSGPTPEQRDVWATVDEEVSRLPARFQAPVVLCYFEGKTVAEAARLLGCPRGTLASRLARARERLRTRLARRGLALTALPAAALVPAAADNACAGLVRRTARGAARYAAGGAGWSEVRAPVAALTEEVLKAMSYRKIALAAAAVVAFAGALLFGGVLAARNGPQAAAEPPPAAGGEGRPESPPAPVTVSRPVSREFTPFERFTGRLEAGRTVEIRAGVGGRLDKVACRVGDEVKKGDVLFEIDPRALQLALGKAEAELARAEARVKQAEADWKSAQELHKNRVVASASLDKSAAALAEAAAALRLARLGVESCRLDLAAARLASPLDGTVTRVNATAGELVSGGDARATVLATVASLDPLRVAFDVDERTFLRHRDLFRGRKDKGPPVPITVQAADEKVPPRRGHIEEVAASIDSSTGALRVWGAIPNRDRALVPGLFVRVRLPTGEPRRVLMVPEDTIFTDQGKHFVWVVNGQDVAEQRTVKLGPADAGMCVIEGGLGADEWVVIAGARGVKAGAKVEPRRAKTPPPAPGQE